MSALHNGQWPLVPLGQILRLQRRWLKLDPVESYGEIGIRCFGKGVFHKAPVMGSSLGNKRVLQIHPGDLVFNNVFAWEGAVAVAGPAEAGKIGSHRFVTYTPDAERCSVEYLKYFFASKAGLAVLGKASPGSAGRNRTLNLDRFIVQCVPLPPLAEQRRLVALIDAVVAKIEEARRLRHQAAEGTMALLKAAWRRHVGDALTATWVPLRTVVKDIVNGWSPACETRPATNGEWGVLKVGAVSFGRFNPHENKALPLSLQPRPEYEIRQGDFLMSRANTVKLVGACAIVEQTPPRLILCDKIFRFVFNEETPVLPRFLDHLLKSPALRDQIERGASGTSPTMKNISKEKVFGLLIPMPTMEKQERITRILDDIQSRVRQLGTQQARVAVELDAMLPSLLDRAFKGEL